ncbi:MAG: hypothetical protein LBP40_03295 [Campylobacteraceae bacterium]|jgi:tetratricopeptide (TPR) repeat protein|nr:hypothetical protein [Campylobacteraceae bacterium]
MNKAIANYIEIKINPNYVKDYYNLGDKRVLANNKINQYSAPAYINRAFTYDVLGEKLKATADYMQAIEMVSDYQYVYNHCGRAYANLEAIADFTEAIKLYSNYIDAYSRHGTAYSKLGDYKNAAKDAQKVCELGDCKLLEFLSQNERLNGNFMKTNIVNQTEANRAEEVVIYSFGCIFVEKNFKK